MTHRQRVFTGGLQTVGALSLTASLALAALGGSGVFGVSAGFGLYRIIAFALGFALIARGLELKAPDAWSYLDSWWNGSTADRRAMLGRYLSIVGQLALLLLLIATFEIETPVFWSRIVPLTFAGCVIHHLTPARYRLAMFLFLSLAAIWLVFTVSDTLWLVGVGVALVALCHLPIPFWGRVALVVLSGVVLAIGRMTWIPVPWSRAIWPILGSIFMFRMIVYLYDLRHEKVPATWPQRLSYFFLLPNVAFPLFPIVDYGMFRRTYYDAEAYRIYQRGVEWIFRGVLHLIAYRFMYARWSVSPSEVTSVAGIAQYMIVSFLLYVRVSGQFHMIVGMLHLFGFHLPPTHKEYFLAASFSDLWRRINIYWKDFMMKVVYYPVLFRLRRVHGERRAMILATLVVFIVTWVLHSYQWFWLLGRFPLTATDGLFWTGLAALLITSTLHEAKHGRVRTLSARVWTTRQLGVQSLKVAGTFATIAFLWSLWMAPSFTDWLSLWSVERVVDARLFDGPPLWLVGAMVTGAAVLPRSRWVMSFTRPEGEATFARSVVMTTVSILAVLFVSQPVVSSRLGDRIGGTIASLRTSQLNPQDLTRLTRGYYEELMGVARVNSRLWEMYMQQPAAEAWPMFNQTPAVKNTSDFLRSELVPNMQINFLGSVLTVNKWGMRDQGYELAKPPGVWRIAVLGTSVDMGWGVGDDETYEQLLERRLNAEAPEGSKRKYEILNFSVAGHTAAQHALILDRVLSFAPDVVFVPGREEDTGRLLDHIIRTASLGIPNPIDTLRKAVEAARAGGATDAVVRKRLEPHRYELLEAVDAEMARRIRQHGAVPLWIFVPMPDGQYDPADIARFSDRAAKSGFEVSDILDTFRGQDLDKIRIATYDRHPNREGHRLLADRLYRTLTERSALLGVGR